MDDKTQQTQHGKDAREARKRKSQLTEKAVLEALRGSAGIVSAAAAKLGVNRSTLKRRIDKSPKLTEAKGDIVEDMLDRCEFVTATMIDRAVQKVQAGQEPSRAENTHVIFYQNFKGKARGGPQQVEIDAPNGLLLREAPTLEVTFKEPETSDGEQNSAGGSGGV